MASNACFWVARLEGDWFDPGLGDVEVPSLDPRSVHRRTTCTTGKVGGEEGRVRGQEVTTNDEVDARFSLWAVAGKGRARK